MQKSINFSHILPDNKKTNTVTPQFYLSFRKDMPNTTKYSKSRKMAIFDQMTRSYKIFCIFLLCMVRYIFFGIKVISRLIGLIYENMPKMANKIFNVPNHLKCNTVDNYVHMSVC